MKNVISFVVLLFLYRDADSRILVVSPSSRYKTVKSAVLASAAGDTVLVTKGIYREGNIVVAKPISLIGETGAVLDGEKKHEILTLSGSHFRVKGVTFRNSGYSSMNDYASIKIIDASDFTIENNTVINAHFAIHIANCHDFTVKSNTITGNPGEEQATGNGIHLWKCSKAYISGNKINGHRDGIYFEFVSSSTVAGNMSEENIRYGLHFMFSNDNIYNSNNFKANGAGVAVMFSRNIHMRSNIFQENKGASSYGLLLKEITDGEITGNQFSFNTTGIYMEGTNRINIHHNKINGNGYAMRVQASCSDNIITQNNFMANSFDISTNGTLVLNTINGNYWDKYEGYDLNKDGKGDIPFHPLSLYAIIAEQNPVALVLLRSFMTDLLDRIEKAIPSITPDNFRDDEPFIKPVTI